MLRSVKPWIDADQRAIREQADEVKRLQDALGTAHDAIAEYYRYWTGGETRGSYDGKPERANLWKALHKARAALNPKQENSNG